MSALREVRLLDHVLARRRGLRPRGFVVAASIAVAVGWWFVIGAMTERLVWFW
jgi:hypothetical protein